MNLSAIKERVKKLKTDQDAAYSSRSRNEVDLIELRKIELYEEVISYLADKYNGIDGDILKAVKELRDENYGKI